MCIFGSVKNGLGEGYNLFYMKSLQVMLNFSHFVTVESSRFTPYIIIDMQRFEVILFVAHSKASVYTEIRNFLHLKRVSSPHSARICSMGNFGRSTRIH